MKDTFTKEEIFDAMAFGLKFGVKEYPRVAERDGAMSCFNVLQGMYAKFLDSTIDDHEDVVAVTCTPTALTVARGLLEKAGV